MLRSCTTELEQRYSRLLRLTLKLSQFLALVRLCKWISIEVLTVMSSVGADRIIDEMIFKCTHTTVHRLVLLYDITIESLKEIDYLLPGVKPTGKPLELALVGVIAFRGDKLTFE
jgi:hypothetical protein